MADKLDILVGKESCPVCGSISQKGTARCPECGTFHSGIHLEDREPPAPEERVAERSFDPSDYSINPLASITDEEFEGVYELITEHVFPPAFVEINRAYREFDQNN